MEKLTACPKRSTLNLNIRQWSLGKRVEIQTPVGCGDDQPSKDLVGDCFWTYYNADATPKEQAPEERYLNARLLDWARKSPEFESSRNLTLNKLANSVASAGMLSSYLMSDDVVKQALEEQKKADEEEQAAENASNEKERQEHKEAARQARQNIAEAMDKLTDEKSIHGKSLMAGAQQAAKNAADGIQSIVSGWGTESAEYSPEAANIFSSMTGSEMFNLSKLAEMLGRAKGVSRKTISENKKPSMVITNAGYTKNLLRLFPAERMRLSPETDPVLQAKAICEFANHGLQGMVTESEPSKQGYMTIMLDQSSSMRGLLTSRAVAASAGLALAANENGSGQGWWICPFNQKALEEVSISSENTPEEFMQWCSKVSATGGTSFTNALSAALGHINNLPEDKKYQSDIIIITDGQSSVDKEVCKAFNDLKETYGTRLVIALVNGANFVDEATQSISSAVISISNDESIESFSEKLNEQIVR